MKILEHKVPPPIIGALIAGVLWLGRWLVPTATFELPYRWVFVGITLVCAVLVAATAIRTFVKAETTTNPLDPDEAESLVTHGIFGYSRNPMYVGLTLILIAIAFGLQNWVSFLLVLLFPLYITRFQIIPEERALAAKFGDAYAAYRKSVRRWL